jgi:4a-hydroxytetrahydrobiopterin dehydratase
MTQVSSPATRVKLTAPQIVAKMAQLQDWRLRGDGADVAIEKTYTFKSYLQTLAFVNAVAFIAEKNHHHPEMLVGYKTCSVSWHTHDLGGISHSDFECALQVEALLSGKPAAEPPLG